MDTSTILGISGASVTALVAILAAAKVLVEKILDIVKTCKEQNKTTAETILICVQALTPRNSNKAKKKNKKQ